MMSIFRGVSVLALLVFLLLTLAAPTVAQTPSASPAASPGAASNTDVICDSCDSTGLESAIDSAPIGGTIEVRGGEIDGPVVIDKPVHLIGVDSPIIDGHQDGTVVRITAPDVVVQGFVIQNSGRNFDKEDSAIYVEAEGAQILDNQLLNTLFGVNAAQSHDIVIANNRILGHDVDPGIRGDGIKVWYSHRARIIGNQIERSRDLLVWYSNDVEVRDNTVQEGRYGFHFMNSDNGTAEHNRLFDNSVGIYLMYGKNFTIRDNLLQGSRGPSGHGLGLKEIDGVTVEGNIIYDNRVGVYIDNSPLSPNVFGYFRRNLIAYNDSGLGLLPSSRNNVFSQNSVVDNLEQVTVLGGGPLGDNQWSEDDVGNFWSNYAGYDADDDGIGDVPFRSEALSEELMRSWPILQLYRFSLAETAVDFGARAVPMFRQEPKLVDDHPLVDPVVPAFAPAPAHSGDQGAATLWSFALLAAAGSAISRGLLGGRMGTKRIRSRFKAGNRRPARTIGPASTDGSPRDIT